MAPVKSALLLALAPAALAFTTAPLSAVRTRGLRLRMSEEPEAAAPAEAEVPAVSAVEEETKKEVTFTEVASRSDTAAGRGENEMGYDWSKALPWMEEPKYCSFGLALPADAKFDPLGFADSEEKLMKLRDAELKHCRLAMLAAAGWPISELDHGAIAKSFGLPSLLVDGKAPSVLNGGLDGVSIAYWLGVIAVGAAIETIGSAKKAGPGDYQFDPLGLADKLGKDWVSAAEVRNGRLAMMAITGFALQEAIYKIPVVKETPIFFEPIGRFFNEYQNSGYL